MPAVSLACLCSSACLLSLGMVLKFLGGWVFIFFKRLFYVERTSVFSCEQSDLPQQLQFIFNNLFVTVLHIRILMIKFHDFKDKVRLHVRYVHYKLTLHLTLK